MNEKDTAIDGDSASSHLPDTFRRDAGVVLAAFSGISGGYAVDDRSSLGR